ncbi:MAG: hypothetical protein PWR10_646 [Halanaerobiales bacterium]|nr:hypothetical protein [Halanaerobiales bacterium]
MDEKPLVSIITPSYNQGQYIKETVNSVLDQTYDNIEYIVVDGGSKDNTLKILERYKNRLTYISEKDNGQSDAINKGFKMAKGEIVGWINSDDILMRDCVETVVDEFIKNNKLGIVYGNLLFIDEEGNQNKIYKVPDIDLDVLLHKRSSIAQPGSFYSMKAVKKVGYLDESLNYVMDYDLWIKLLKISEIKYLDKVLAKFREHNQSKSVSQLDKFTSEKHRVINKYGGSIDILPNKYLKENCYDYWCDKLKPLLVKAFEGAYGKNIGIYGTGGHTTGMLGLYEDIFGDIDFNIFFFDSNEDYWGEKFLNRYVYSPEQINDLELDRIIISSYLYQDEIFKIINNLLKKEVKIIKLYNKDDLLFFI